MKRRTKLGVAGFVGMALVAAPMAALPAYAAPSETVDINLLNINDFHGRIDANTVQFAGTVERLRAEAAEGSTLFLSAGDNIGASLFASSSQDDEPTLDVLNALDLDTSAVGNHEFDKGLSDLTGRVSTSANWDYLGANVYRKGTQTPALQEYDIFDVNGVRVAVIGAITEETPTLVSPGGVSTIDFGDPVEAVNRVANQLTTQDLADVIVAEYHEGASAGTPDGATLAEELALTDSAFAEIVTETSSNVDAIFTGHTHKQYAWDAQIPGAAAGETRPVLQTGSYGEYIGQIKLSYDTTAEKVVSHTAANVQRPVITNSDPVKAAELLKAADAAFVAQYPRAAEVKTIVDAALAEAAIRGNVPVGTITQDITRAFSTVKDDRGSESTLGNLVADSLLSSLSGADVGGAEIGVVNPGGLREELTYKSSAAGEGDGVVTYAEANAVLPFVNNLWTTTLTGAQFKTVLEQQWQLDAAGNVPSRPFLNLGLSDNVSYTYDASRAQGDRVTSITVNGAPIELERGYRIGSFNFLLQGGDNFREFSNGTNTRDSGLVDRDAWIAYLAANKPVAPSFDRRAVAVTGIPTEVLEVGATGSISLSKLDLTSLGSPVNTEVSAVFEGSAAAAVVAPVTAGAATVAYTVPADVQADATLVITAKESGTVVRIPVSVAVVTPPVDPTDPTDPTTPVDPTDPTTPTDPELPETGPEAPATAAVAAGEASLTPALAGDITVSDNTVALGQKITVNVGVEHAGEYVAAFLYSTPVALTGWVVVDAAGQISVTIPTTVAAGVHRIAVQDVNGTVLGWTTVTVAASATATAAQLAATGTDTAPTLAAGALLLLLGAGLVLGRRRIRGLVAKG